MTETLVKLRRSAVPGKIPSDSQLQLGEVAINTYDGKMFFKKSAIANTVLEVAVISNGLGQFANTTSAQLASMITDETGSGSLVFSNSPTLTSPIISGNTSFDSGTLFIDSLNNRIGISNVSPDFKLHVNNGSALSSANNSSAGMFRLETLTNNSDFLTTKAVRLADGSDWTTAAWRMERQVDATVMGYMQFGSMNSDLITFGENATEYMRIDGSGRVGIGISPSSRLHVLGDIQYTNQLISTIATGNAPFIVSSTTRVQNLNVATANTADTLTTSRTLWGQTFNGSQNISGNLSDVGTITLGTQTNKATITYTANTARTYTIPEVGASATFIVGEGSQTLTGQKTFTNTPIITGTVPTLEINETDQAVDAKRWFFKADGSNLIVQAINDAGSGGGNYWRFTRTGNQISSLEGMVSGIRSLSLSNTGRSITFTGASAYIGTSDDQPIYFTANNVTRMIVSSNGNIGIGTISPSTALEVNGEITAIDYNTTSDLNVKENIEKITDAVDKILQLNGVTFNFIDEIPKTRHAGVIAQDVEKVLPEAVKEMPNGIKHVAYGNLIGLLIEAIKEQQNQINYLINRIK